jgi:hypothetical protein
MVDKAGGYNKLAKCSKTQEGVRLTKEGRQCNKRKHKHCDMNKYCDTSELTQCAEKFKLPNANIYLAQQT